MTTDSTDVLVICPPENALKDNRYGFKCPYPHCNELIRRTGSVSTHLLKVHNVNEGTKQEGQTSVNCIKTRYHCPVEKCKYNSRIGDRHFSCMKLLLQHYGKVHAEKKNKCEKCGVGFGMDKDRRHHQKGCGLTFQCGQCSNSYVTLEAMMTHCRRLQHKLPVNYIERNHIEKTVSTKKLNPVEMNGKSDGNLTTPSASNNPGFAKGSNSAGIGALLVLNIIPNTTNVIHSNGLKPILPKPLSMNIIPVSSLTSVNRTLMKKVSNTTSFGVGVSHIGEKGNMPKNNDTTDKSKQIDTCTSEDLSQSQSISAGIQTCIGDKSLQDLDSSCLAEKSTLSTGIQTSITFKPGKVKPKNTVAQTQTSGDLILKKAMASADIPIQMESIGTQVTPRSKPRNLKRANLCSSETQTSDVNSGIKRKRRRRLSGPGYRLKMDSVCQTPYSNNTKSVSSVGTHTDLKTHMVDSVSQVESTNLLPLNDVVYAEFNKNSSTGKVFERGDAFLKRMQIGNIDEVCQTGFTTDSFAQTNFAIPSLESQSAQVDMDELERVLSSKDKLFHSLSTQTSISETGRNNLPLSSDSDSVPVSQVSEGTDPIDFDSDAILSMAASLGAEDSLNNPNTQRAMLKQSDDLDTSTDDLFASGDFSNLLGKSQDMGIQTFEADFQKFLLSECNNLSSLRQHNQINTTETQVQTQNSSSDIDVLLQDTGQQMGTSSGYFANNQTQTAVDVIDMLVNNMETQTNSDISFESLPLADIQTQTTNENMGSLDLITSINRSEENRNGDWTMSDFGLTSSHTQTSNNFGDAGTGTCVSTQTLPESTSFEDMSFDFSLADIQTQTTNQIQGDNVSTQTSFIESSPGSQASESTQTALGNGLAKKVSSANIETQTSVLNFMFTDMQTQTRFDELDELLSKFNQ